MNESCEFMGFAQEVILLVLGISFFSSPIGGMETFLASPL